MLRDIECQGWLDSKLLQYKNFWLSSFLCVCFILILSSPLFPMPTISWDSVLPCSEERKLFSKIYLRVTGNYYYFEKHELNLFCTTVAKIRSYACSGTRTDQRITCYMPQSQSTRAAPGEVYCWKKSEELLRNYWKWTLQNVAVYIRVQPLGGLCGKGWGEKKERARKIDVLQGTALHDCGDCLSQVKFYKKSQKEMNMNSLETCKHRSFVVFKLREGPTPLLKAHLIRSAPPRIMFLFFSLRSTVKGLPICVIPSQQHLDQRLTEGFGSLQPSQVHSWKNHQGCWGS